MKTLKIRSYIPSVCLLLFLSLITLSFGEIPLKLVFNDLFDRLQGKSVSWNALYDERIPRLIVIVCSGASLSVSGALIQALFKNPLASPNILGISAGGSLSVIFVFMAEWQMRYPFAIPIAAFIGSLVTLHIVYLLAYSKGEGVSIKQLILIGMSLSTLLAAIQATIMYCLREEWVLVQTLSEWEMGSTVDRQWSHVHMQLPLTLVALACCWHYRAEIDILSLGDEEAKALGVDVETIRWRLFLSIGLLVGGTIASVGMIAFFGLALPHIVRYFSKTSFRHMFPQSILLGGIIFLAIDLFLRYFKLFTFTVGNISSILGGLFFLLLTIKSKKHDTRYSRFNF